jgi:hypothetical protein
MINAANIYDAARRFAARFAAQKKQRGTGDIHLPLSCALIRRL